MNTIDLRDSFAYGGFPSEYYLIDWMYSSNLGKANIKNTFEGFS